MSGRVTVSRLTPAVVVFASSVGFLIWTYAYTGRGHMLPALTGWFLVIMSFLDIVAATPTRIGAAIADFFAGKVIGEPKGYSHGTAGRVLMAAAWPGLFVLGVIFFGFFVAIPIYVFAFMLLHGKKKPREALIGAAATTLFTLVVFEWLLNYEVFRGIVFGGI